MIFSSMGLMICQNDRWEREEMEGTSKKVGSFSLKRLVLCSVHICGTSLIWEFFGQNDVIFTLKILVCLYLEESGLRRIRRRIGKVDKIELCGLWVGTGQRQTGKCGLPVGWDWECYFSGFHIHTF